MGSCENTNKVRKEYYMSFLGKLFTGKSTDGKDKVVQALRKCGKDCPGLKQLTEPLAVSIDTGIDPAGEETNYLEVANLIEGVVIGVARNKGYLYAIPQLKKIAKLM